MYGVGLLLMRGACIVLSNQPFSGHLLSYLFSFRFGKKKCLLGTRIFRQIMSLLSNLAS